MQDNSFQKSFNRARTFLYVPAHRTELYDKALCSEADAIIIDLEDSVPEGKQEKAIESLRTYWPATTPQGSPGKPTLLRIPKTESHKETRRLLKKTSFLRYDALVLSKCEDKRILAGTLRAASRIMKKDIPGVPLIETPKGILAAAQLCSTRGVIGAMFGAMDYSAATHVLLKQYDGSTPLAAWTMANAAYAAGVKPIGPVIRYGETMEQFLDTYKALGFEAFQTISPNDAALANTYLPASEKEKEYILAIQKDMIVFADKEKPSKKVMGMLHGPMSVKEAKRLISMLYG